MTACEPSAVGETGEQVLQTPTSRQGQDLVTATQVKAASRETDVLRIGENTKKGRQIP